MIGTDDLGRFDFLQLASGGQHTAFQTGRELVVGAGLFYNLGAQFDGIITQRGEPFVQFSGQIEQLLGVIGERLLLPGYRPRISARPRA